MNEEYKKDIPTATTWHWAITPEDVERIKANDRETINRVYFDNLRKFERIAHKYIAVKRAVGLDIDRTLAEDIRQQIYIDLPLYDYTNTLTFYYGLARTCYNVVFGKSAFGYERLDKNAFDDSASGFGQRFIAEDIADNLEREESEKRALYAIGNQRALTNSQKDMLTAYALRVRCYYGIFETEYKRAFGGAI